METVMETVEEFLARGGRIQSVRTGKKGAKKSAPNHGWIVWDDLTQSLAIEQRFPTREAAYLAAAGVQHGGHPVAVRTPACYRGLPWADDSAVESALS